MGDWVRLNKLLLLPIPDLSIQQLWPNWLLEVIIVKDFLTIFLIELSDYPIQYKSLYERTNCSICFSPRRKVRREDRVKVIKNK